MDDTERKMIQEWPFAFKVAPEASQETLTLVVHPNLRAAIAVFKYLRDVEGLTCQEVALVMDHESHLADPVVP